MAHVDWIQVSALNSQAQAQAHCQSMPTLKPKKKAEKTGMGLKGVNICG